ncbi:45230_t:CDS:2, partial [Gigaspora margarita]
IIAATIQPEIIKNSKKSKLTTEYNFEENQFAISFEIIMKVITFIGNFAKQNGLPSPADTTYSSLHIQYLEAIKTNNQFGVCFTTFINIWKKYLLHIKKLTPCSDLCLKCKDMRFNANYWMIEEKEAK